MHLQRRYRSGFTPDCLVQQPGPHAWAATKTEYSVVTVIVARLPCLVNGKPPPAIWAHHTFSPARKYAKSRRETFRRFPGPFPRPKVERMKHDHKQHFLPLPLWKPLVKVSVFWRKQESAPPEAKRLFARKMHHTFSPERKYA